MRLAAVLMAALCGALPASAAPVDRWLVPAFEPSVAGRQHLWMGEGVAVVLIEALRVRGVPVLSQAERSRMLERRGVAPGGVLTHATLLTLARAVEAARVVVGSFAVEGGVLRVSARVLAAAPPSLSAVLEEQGPLPEFAVIVERLAARLVPDRPPAVSRFAVMPPAAIERLARALSASSEVAQLALLDQAVSLAPEMYQARLEAWEIRTRREQHEVALAQVRRVPEGAPETHRAQLLAAVSLMALRRVDEAFTRLTLLSRIRRDAAVLNNLGVLQLRRGEPAGTYFADAQAADPADPDIHFNTGYAAWRRGDPASAVVALREAVRLSASDAQAHHVLSLALASTGKGIEAAYEQAIAERLSAELAGLPSAAVAGWERLRLDVDGEGPARVDRLMDLSEQRAHEQLARTYLAHGQRLHREGRLAEAVAELRRAVHLSPYDGEAHRGLAEVHLAAGQAQAAVEAATLAVFSRDAAASRLVLAEALMGTGQRTAARAELDLVLKWEPDNEKARRLLALQ